MLTVNTPPPPAPVQPRARQSKPCTPSEQRQRALGRLPPLQKSAASLERMEQTISRASGARQQPAVPMQARQMLLGRLPAPANAVSASGSSGSQSRATVAASRRLAMRGRLGGSAG